MEQGLLSSSSSSSSSSWREAFSRSIPPLQFVARTICLLPAPERRSAEFPCPGRCDESRWWEVDLEHASSRETPGHYLEFRSRSEGSGWLGHHQRVWQRDRIIQGFACRRWQRPRADRCNLRLHHWRRNRTVVDKRKVTKWKKSNRRPIVLIRLCKSPSFPATEEYRQHTRGIYTVSGTKDQQFSLRSFNKYKRIFTIFGTHYPSIRFTKNM